MKTKLTIILRFFLPLSKKNILILTLALFHMQNLFSQWEVKHVQEDFNETLHVLKFFDRTTGFAMGSNALILKSIDEGETWEKIENEIAGRITDFEFITLDTVLALSADYDGTTFTRRIYKSIDGGLNWEENYVEEGGFTCLQFINDQVGIVSGSNNILKSYDGGESWESVFDLAQSGFEFGGINRFEMVTDSVGFALGNGAISNPNLTLISILLKTTDGGNTWQEIGQFNYELVAVDFINEDEGYMSDELLTYKTIDGGMSWDTLTSLHGVIDFSTPSSNKVVTVNRPFVYTVGAPSTEFAISESLDAGNTWEGEYAFGGHLESVFFQTDSIGFVAGDYSIIMKTENCGGEITGDYPWHLFTSTNELQVSNLKCYPNPSTDKLFITEIENNAGWEYSIKTIDGISVKEGRMNKEGIDVAQFTKGVYVLLLEREGEKRVGRFVKQ